jgi:DNA-binding PadR family transcriptional regulator
MNEPSRDSEPDIRDPIVADWVAQIRGKRLAKGNESRVLLEAWKPNPQVYTAILAIVQESENEGSPASRAHIRSRMKREVPGSETLDSYLDYLKEKWFITDKPGPYRAKGIVKEKHSYRLTQRGRNALPRLRAAVREIEAVLKE